MKILSCFSKLSEIKPLAAAGADELYCAVPAIPAFGDPASLPGIPALKTAVREAHGLGLKLLLAANSRDPMFTRGEEARTLANYAEADAAGVDAFIVTNPSVFTLLSRVKRRKAKLHLSSVQPCFNSLTAELFIGLGVSRIILPNQLSPFEAGKILKLCRARGVETEIFDYRFFGCAYINGRCHLHRPEYYTLAASVSNGSMCRLNFKSGALPAPGAVDVDPSWKPDLGPVAKRLALRLTYGGAPRIGNAASLYDFFSAGVDCLKYGTRQDPSELKIKKVKALRALLDLAEESAGMRPLVKGRAYFIEKMTKWSWEKFTT